MAAAITQSVSAISENAPQPLGLFSVWHNHFVTWIKETISSYQIMQIEPQEPCWKRVCKVVAGPFMLLLCTLWSLGHFCLCIKEGHEHLNPAPSQPEQIDFLSLAPPRPEDTYRHQISTALSAVDEQRGLDIIRALSNDARNLFHNCLVKDAIAKRKSPEFIQELLRLGFSPICTRYPYDPPALQLAIGNNLSGIARVLLAHGARGDAKSLSIACSKENTEMVQILLEAHAPLNDDFFFPLHIAAGRANREIMDLLVQAGADIRGVNRKNETLLHRICGEGQILMIPGHYGDDLVHLRVPPGVQRQIVAWLIDQNVPILAQNQRGHTALGSAARAWYMAPWSEKHQYERIADLLVERGADRAEWERVQIEMVSERDDLDWAL